MSLLENRGATINDLVGGKSIKIILSTGGQVIEVWDDRSRSIPVIFAYWFAWQAFHPQTTVYAETN
jgi:hypothetical protein